MRKFVLAVGVVALAVAGCSNADTSEEVQSEAQATGSARAGSDLAAEAGSTEVEGPEPRLVIADADSNRIKVLDLSTEEELASFEAADDARLSSINGRYVVATGDRSAYLYDPGSWTIDHGDHTHSYTKDPVEIGVLDGDEPAHVVAGDRKVSVFFDGTGEAKVVDFESLSKVDATVGTTIESQPQHGFAAPLADHFVVTTGGTTEDLPTGLELRDESGNLVRALDGVCPEMHGEAVFSQYLVVACQDGVMKVDASADFATTKFAYPPNAARAWSLEEGSRGALVAAPTETGVLILDTLSGQWVEAKTGDETVAAAMSSNGKTVMSLQQDGSFKTFDALTGAELSSTPVAAGPVEDGAQIQVGGNRAYVSVPSSKSVVEIDYRDGGRIARTFDLDYSPGSIGVIGA